MMAWRWRYWIERNNQPWSCSKTKSCFPKKKRFQWFLREELHPYSSCSRRLLSAKRPPTPKEKQFFACQTLNERCCLQSTIDNKIGGRYSSCSCSGISFFVAFYYMFEIMLNLSRYVKLMSVCQTYVGMSNLWWHVKFMMVCQTCVSMSNLCKYVKLV